MLLRARDRYRMAKTGFLQSTEDWLREAAHPPCGRVEPGPETGRANVPNPTDSRITAQRAFDVSYPHTATIQHVMEIDGAIKCRSIPMIFLNL